MAVNFWSYSIKRKAFFLNYEKAFGGILFSRACSDRTKAADIKLKEAQFLLGIKDFFKN